MYACGKKKQKTKTERERERITRRRACTRMNKSIYQSDFSILQRASDRCIVGEQGYNLFVSLAEGVIARIKKYTIDTQHFVHFPTIDIEGLRYVR